MKLSILIPVFNEEKTIQTILDKVYALEIPKITKEIVIVDDGSTDNTAAKIKTWMKKNNVKNVKYFYQENQGKGAAVSNAIQKATGEYVIIQDADLEYDPKQITLLVAALREKGRHVVYGTRLHRLPHLGREERRGRFLLHYFGNRMLSLFTSILYGQWITDMETCYKLFPTGVFKKNPLISKGFELEPEITAKLMKVGYVIIEVPITTTPRGYDEGKKLHTVRDGIKALRALIQYRFTK